MNIKSLLLKLTPLLSVIVISYISFTQLGTPEPALPGYTPDSYSAYRAIEHLKIIAKEPHSGGTVAHRQVRNYIYDFCRNQGLETKVMNQVGMTEYTSSAVAGNVFNILAKFKGSDHTKAVLVMAHYDSQPNTPGAADDGSGVASMLEVIELLTKQGPLKNDIYFLFTDLEEVGLLGAEAFVRHYKDLDDIGLILNFEARGNTGANFTFETSPENGWIVPQFAQATDRPLANSLAYEIYKLMPNDTDFTKFKPTGISGLNSGFIDGYVYYHSAVDTPQNLDLGSLQNQGDLMWQNINHFGNLDLTETKADDLIFFSVFSHIFYYSATWDWPLIVLAILLVGALIWKIVTDQRVRLIEVVKGLLSYLLVILCCSLLVYALVAIVLWVNPHYANFYSYNFYNATTYVWLVVGSGLLAMALVHQFVFKKNSIEGNILGALLLHVILLLVIKQIVPTGGFILYVPLLVGVIILFIDRKSKAAAYLLPVVPLILWVPFIYFLFVVFSLSLPYASAFFLVLLYPYLLCTLDDLSKVSMKLTPLIAPVIMVVGFVYAQMNSSPTPKRPLQTKLVYGINMDTQEAIWFSSQKNKDEFISSYIPNTDKQNLNLIYPESQREYWMAKATPIAIDSTKVQVLLDTTLQESREIQLRLTFPEGTTYTDLALTNGYFMAIDGRPITKTEISAIRYNAPKKQGTQLIIQTSTNEPIELNIVASKLGIDKKLLKHPLPANYIFGTGSMSNNMLIKSTIKL